jgi:hypothetical protein
LWADNSFSIPLIELSIIEIILLKIKIRKFWVSSIQGKDFHVQVH